MNDAVLPHLRCPNCRSVLTARDVGGPLRCPRGHSFDIARQGYATLTAGRTPHSGDSAEMVVDRERFLAAGHYAFIADALAAGAARVLPALTGTLGTAATSALPGQITDAAALAAPHVAPDSTNAPAVAAGQVSPDSTNARASAAGLVVDAGTGTGYYLARVLDALPSAVGLGLDVSKSALRRAARSHPRADAALADLWQPLPLADASVALILDAFAPRNGAEFHRVLHPDGALLVVSPAADHLTELIDAYGLIGVDPNKADRLSDSLGTHFTAIATTTHRYRMHLVRDEVRTLIGMTPSARHVPSAAIETTTPTEVTAAIDLTTYRRTRT